MRKRRGKVEKSSVKKGEEAEGNIIGGEVKNYTWNTVKRNINELRQWWWWWWRLLMIIDHNDYHTNDDDEKNDKSRFHSWKPWKQQLQKSSKKKSM